MSAEEIRKRASEIQELGAHLGLFELLLWGEVGQCGVTLLLGNKQVDVRGFCGQSLPPVAAVVKHHFAGVLLKGRTWLAPAGERHINKINHYVVAVPAPKALAEDGLQPAGGNAKEVAAAAGWRLVATAAQGDCAIDCMAYWCGRPRTLETFAEIRALLADFARSVADDARWQDAFLCCAEGGLGPAGAAPAGAAIVQSPGPSMPLPPLLPHSPGKGPMAAASSARIAPTAAALSTPAKRPRTGCRSPCQEAEALQGAASPKALADAAAGRPTDAAATPEAAKGPDCAAAAVALPSPAASETSLVCSPVLAAGRAGFQQWLLDMPDEERGKRVRSYADFLEAQAEFAAAVPKREPSAALVQRGPRAVHRASRLRDRLAIGIAYLAWRKAEGAAAAAPLVAFMRTQRRYTGRVPKKDTVWLARCARLAASDEIGQLGLVPRGACGGKRPPTHEGRTPTNMLLRRRLRQGPPAKCPVIRELLWDWFVDIRSSVAARLSPRLVLAKARQLADQVLQEQRATHQYEQLPVLDKSWLLRWKREKGVVFRRPNMRYKCSKAVLLARLRAMWRNTFAVRRLAQRLLSTDLATAFMGIDEKPLHFNEGGSKGARTLDIAGQGSVRLKENHAATRSRLSVMTTVVSSMAAAVNPDKVPVELLFRGTQRRIAKLKVPAGMAVTLACGPKGSYREDTIIQFLERHLPAWTEARAAANDYRVLMLDVAASHCGDAVWQAAWSRGFVTLLHYGCTTGVCQVNDTALHGPLSRVYIDLEQGFFNEQQLHEPGNINRRPQDVVDDFCSAWRSLDHAMGVRGHLHNGLTNALDGSQDHLITGEARHCWLELDMAAVREQTLREVDALVDSGAVTTFAEWRSVLRHPDDQGVLWDEGAELEGEVVPGELLWLADPDADAESADLQDIAEVPDAGAEAMVKAAATDEAQVAVREACSQAARLDKLKQLRARLAEVRVPSMSFQLEREIVAAERGLRVMPGSDPAAAALLRKALQAKAAAEAKKLAEVRAKHRARISRLQQARLLASKRKREEAAAAALAATAASARAAELLRLPLTFQPAEVDGRSAAAVKARGACLQRVKLKSPALPDDLEVNWPKLRDEYALRYPATVVGHSGTAFLRAVNEMLRCLGTHYDGRTKFNNPPRCGGDRRAFEKFVRAMRESIPSSALAASV